jgi:hypothetical protein
MTELSRRHDTIVGSLSGRDMYYDLNVKAFSSKTRAEEYIKELHDCSISFRPRGNKLQNMRFDIREVEISRLRILSWIMLQ